jgi:hypothetical protein
VVQSPPSGIVHNNPGVVHSPAGGGSTGGGSTGGGVVHGGP